MPLFGGLPAAIFCGLPFVVATWHSLVNHENIALQTYQLSYGNLFCYQKWNTLQHIKHYMYVACQTQLETSLFTSPLPKVHGC